MEPRVPGSAPEGQGGIQNRFLDPAFVLSAPTRRAGTADYWFSVAAAARASMTRWPLSALGTA